MRVLVIRFLILLGLFFPALASAASYTDNHDGTVTDAATGLTWMRCSMGQTWDGSTCTGTASTYTWDQARALTQSFAGQSDWRLPNIRELQTITDTAAFPNTPTLFFWSASPSAYNPAGAWFVYFGLGFSSAGSKTNSYCVRLVRGGQSLALLSDARLDSDYTDNGDGTVTHKPTGLMWKRCSEGQTWYGNGGTCTGTANTNAWYSYSTRTSFAEKSGWRLPTKDELLSLVDYTRSNPAINATLFPNTAASNFWSDSHDVSIPYSAWSVNFGGGIASSSSLNSTLSFRLVCGGQPV